MTARIIPFPTRTPEHKKYKSVDLYHCWNASLNNPLLNSLFKTETSYVERWYLQTTHLLHIEDYGHPLLLILFSEKDTTLDKLITATEKDLAIHHTLANKSPMYIAQPNIIRLTRWLNKWKSLKNHRQLLYSS